MVELLLDMAQRDDRLYQSLLLKAERTGGGGNVAKAFRRAIDNATRIQGYVDWREVRSFAANIDQVVDSLAELLQPDTAATLVELSEYAIERVEHALEQIDDSNGSVGGTVAAWANCTRKPAPWHGRNPPGWPNVFSSWKPHCRSMCAASTATYRDVLGREGLRRYRELAEAEWRKIKPRDSREGYDGNRYHITRIMEQLAQASGDIEELVAIKSRDLSSGYSYLQIAEI